MDVLICTTKSKILYQRLYEIGKKQNYLDIPIHFVNQFKNCTSKYIELFNTRYTCL